MAKYHINKEGIPSICRAQKKCPLGSNDHHYGSPEKAVKAFEKQQEKEFKKAIKSVSKKGRKWNINNSHQLDQIVKNLGNHGSGTSTGTLEDPINVHGNTLLAAKLLSEGKHIRLDKVYELGTLLEDLSVMVKEAEEKGEDAPTFDLCKVSVPKVNLFCAQSKGVPRVEMPQLTGFAQKGSPASYLPSNDKGKVDLSSEFKAELIKRGVNTKQMDVKASFLKASQNELDGVKVAKKLKKMDKGTFEDKVIFVTRDNYILDGHHYYASKVGFAAKADSFKELTLRVEVVDMEIGEALDFANYYTQEMGVGAKNIN
jgi:hypothetical protein